MSEGRTTLTFSDLRPYLLLENGNYLYKVPFRGGFAVLKVYYGSHGPLARWGKSLANVLLYGQTSYAPRTRRRVERRCLALWARHGFRTFGVHDGVRVQAPGCPEDGYLLLEFVERPRLCDVLPTGPGRSPSGWRSGAGSWPSGAAATNSPSPAASRTWCTRTGTAST